MRPIALIIVLFAAVASAQTTQPGVTRELSGFVTDRVGNPIAGAEVDLFSGGRSFEPPRPFTKLGHTTTDSHGRFVFKDVRKPSEQFPHVVRATAPGMGYSYRNGPMNTGAEMLNFGRPRGANGPDEAWLILEPAETIRGRVMDESGAPVVGAEVHAQFPIDPVPTNDNGEFTIDRATPAAGDYEGNRILFVHHPDFVIDRVGQSRYSNNVQAMLRHGVLVQGRMSEVDSGAAVESGSVKVQFERSGDAPYYNDYFASCGADGRYRLRLPADLGIADLHPLVSMIDNPTRRYEPTEQFRRIVTDSADHFDVDFTFRRKPDVPRLRADRPRAPVTRPSLGVAHWDKLNLAGIKGNVVDENGKPVGGALLEVMDLVTEYEMDPSHPGYPKKPVNMTARASFSGEFRCRAIDSDQPLLIFASDANGRTAQVTTEPGTREIELRLTSRGARLTGTIRDENGKPVDGLPVYLSLARGERVMVSLARGVTDAAGRYEVVGYHPPAKGTRTYLYVDSPQFNWTDGPEQRVRSADTRYVYFPVKPGETLDGLDYQLVQRGERVAIPTREEFTREP